MTNREFLTNIVNGTVTEAEVEMAKALIEKMDAKNAKRSSKPSKTAVANEPVKKAIVEFLGEHKNALASEVGAGLEITTQKASALLRQLVADGLVTVADVKIPKKGQMKAYSVAE